MSKNRPSLIGSVPVAHAMVLLLLCWAAAPWLRGAEPSTATSPRPAWWVWNRASALSTEELALLKNEGVQELQWNLGTLERKGSEWRGAEKFPVSWMEAKDGLTIIPVVRLHHAPATVEEPAADAALAGLLARLCERVGCKTVQLDYDCPDRLLPRYAELLARVRRSIAPVRLSVTALANWPRVPGFKELAANVDELVPMFYDLESDAVAERRAPLLSSAVVREQIPLWKACPSPWRAGLPNFTRVTLLDAQSKAMGHVNTWQWDTLVFDSALQVSRHTSEGLTELRAQMPMRVGRTATAEGGGLLVRWPDLKVLHTAADTAREAGARGVVIFKLPQADSPSGWSLGTIHTALDKAPIEESEAVVDDFALQWDATRLTLHHRGKMDLPPRFAAGEGTEAGWTLELDLPPTAVTDMATGEFGSRGITRDRQAGQVALRFPQLRAGASLNTGYFKVSHPPASLRWRIPQLSPLWQSAALSPTP